MKFCADLSIRRAVAFGTLAIGTITVGMSFDAALAARTAAILTTLMSAVLLLKAHMAPRQPYRRTEMWLLLDRDAGGLPDEQAQRLIGGLLADRYRWHADATAAVALALWVMALLLSVVR
ncbi:MAG: hypothetical protein WD270_00360 [Acetobacterales bacterium]